MNHVYVTADTHFGHKRVTEFRPFATVEEHDRTIVERWNAVVRPKDTVWHLGDVFFGKNTHPVLAALNGNKKLVLGNHDHHQLHIYQLYFTKIFGAAEYSDAILTHVPIHPNQMSRYKMNIHGHMHRNEVMADLGVADQRYFCVSMEHTEYKPILMQEALM